ncbi:Stk1 family PASTA domain-containing Ser/Thr kinase [Brachybacterium phenoliresistens]|uniref:non-specific serine/threonine protein kinase n=1 Tax=Brachybacterium phenoliresistens TaxID=396014 RepID=Z9JQC2_9MICO|nr:Stk1 family PASTA domain-containing Ser/Thr kinase [Brachybacterium phenoliresistens]EWS79952.1 protein kinase [Brachybacterium phenoliresistens]
MNADEFVLSGRYRVGRLLGHGGMAEVYLAEDTRLHRTVAVKILRSDLARDATFQERFRREAQSAGGLNHPSIVSVYDTGEDTSRDAAGNEIGVPYIVMEYVEGHTLREYIDPENPMDAAQAVRITTALLSALEFSHDAGIVHRDIKPGNVMITATGAVKVMDFGIARAVADAASAMTQTQAVMGTAQYLSPEQARGQLVDNRTDLYSAACVLYEMLTGRPPFTGDSPVSIAYQHVREAPQAPSVFNPAITPEMDQVLLTALAKDREARYPSAAEFSRDLQAVVGGRTPQLVGGAAARSAGAASDAETTTVLSAADLPTEALSPTRTTGRHAAVAGGAAGAGYAAGSAASPLDGGTGPLAAQDGQLVAEEKHRRPVWLFVLVAIAVLAVIGASLAILRPWDPPGPETVTVPTLTGLNSDQITVKLDEVGLTPAFESVSSTEVDKGLFISSDPAPGESAETGDTVNVTLSSGPADTEVPDVSGKTRADAEQLIRDAGLEPAYQADEDVAKAEAGTVTRTNPRAESPVTQGTQVQFWVATGNVAVPQLVGLDEESAKKAIEDAGLVADVQDQEAPDEEPGTVLSQNPTSASNPVANGSTVQIFVARERGPVTVPNVAGDTLDNARTRLSEAGFGMNPPQYEPSDSVAEGVVIRTDPEGNEQAEYGSSVTVVVSSGPEQTTAPTPTENPTTPSTEPTTPTPDQEDPTTEPSADPTTDEAAPGNGNGNGSGNGNGNAAGGRG